MWLCGSHSTSNHHSWNSWPVSVCQLILRGQCLSVNSMHWKLLSDVIRHTLLMSRVVNFSLGVEKTLLKCIFSVFSPAVLALTFQILLLSMMHANMEVFLKGSLLLCIQKHVFVPLTHLLPFLWLMPCKRQPNSFAMEWSHASENIGSLINWQCLRYFHVCLSSTGCAFLQAWLRHMFLSNQFRLRFMTACLSSVQFFCDTWASVSVWLLLAPIFLTTLLEMGRLILFFWDGDVFPWLGASFICCCHPGMHTCSVFVVHYGGHFFVFKVYC